MPSTTTWRVCPSSFWMARPRQPMSRRPSGVANHSMTRSRRSSSPRAATKACSTELSPASSSARPVSSAESRPIRRSAARLMRAMRPSGSRTTSAPMWSTIAERSCSSWAEAGGISVSGDAPIRIGSGGEVLELGRGAQAAAAMGRSASSTVRAARLSGRPATRRTRLEPQTSSSSTTAVPWAAPAQRRRISVRRCSRR